MKKRAIFALVMAFATTAAAHSRVDTTTPPDGATVAEIPADISLNFARDIRLTRVDMVGQDAQPIRLDLGVQTHFGRAFILPVPGGTGKGTYRIEWRGLGADGHAMQGGFSFTVE